MNKVTQSNASGAEETASAAEQLNAQASALQESVADLRRLVGAAKATMPARPTTEAPVEKRTPLVVDVTAPKKPAVPAMMKARLLPVMAN